MEVETHPGADDVARDRGPLRSLGHSMGLGLILGEQPVEGSAERQDLTLCKHW